MFGQPKVKVPWRVRLRTSNAILRQSWRLVRRERDLWVFPVWSTLLFLVLSGAIILLFLLFDTQELLGRWMDGSLAWLIPFATFVLFIPITFPFMLLGSVIQTAYAYALYERMEGRLVNRRVAWSRAWRRLGTLTRFNLVALLVAGLLQFVGAFLQKLNLVPFLGRFVQATGAFAWGVAAYFVIPVIAVQGERSSLSAVKQSAQLARTQWGKSVAGMVTIGLALMVPVLVATLVFMVLVLGGVFWGLSMGSEAFAFATLFVGMGILALALLVAVAGQAALQPAYQTALYRYARTGRIAEPFDRSTVVDAWAPYREA